METGKSTTKWTVGIYIENHAEFPEKITKNQNFLPHKRGVEKSRKKKKRTRWTEGAGMKKEGKKDNNDKMMARKKSKHKQRERKWGMKKNTTTNRKEKEENKKNWWGMAKISLSGILSTPRPEKTQ